MGTTPTGLLSAPKDKLRKVLAACPTIQNWFSAPPLAPIDKIRYSFVRSIDDEIGEARPFAVIQWATFHMRQIAGGDQNHLWPDKPLLRVILTDNDIFAPVDPAVWLTDDEIIEGDIVFENRVGAVLSDLASLAAVNDYLAINEINLEIPPTRNPPKDWAAGGAYQVCSFLVTYN